MMFPDKQDSFQDPPLSSLSKAQKSLIYWGDPMSHPHDLTD